MAQPRLSCTCAVSPSRSRALCAVMFMVVGAACMQTTTPIHHFIQHQMGGGMNSAMLQQAPQLTRNSGWYGSTPFASCADISLPCTCFAVCRYTTQLVVKLDSQRRVRAVGGKTLYQAFLAGVPVVDVSWLTDSVQQGRLLPVDDYMAQVPEFMLFLLLKLVTFVRLLTAVPVLGIPTCCTRCSLYPCCSCMPSFICQFCAVYVLHILSCSTCAQVQPQFSA